MHKYLALAGLMMVSALVTPTILTDYVERQAEVENAPQSVNATSRPIAKNPPAKKTARRVIGKAARIEADDRGHFVVNARLNGRSSKVLVDTGATYVSINESTARKLGIRLKDSDFKYKVNTANGVAYAAATTIDEIRIGRVRVYDVPASVSRDGQLSITLLGMSFLNKLDKFSIENGTLLLKQ